MCFNSSWSVAGLLKAIRLSWLRTHSHTHTPFPYLPFVYPSPFPTASLSTQSTLPTLSSLILHTSTCLPPSSLSHSLLAVFPSPLRPSPSYSSYPPSFFTPILPLSLLSLLSISSPPPLLAYLVFREAFTSSLVPHLAQHVLIFPPGQTN